MTVLRIFGQTAAMVGTKFMVLAGTTVILATIEPISVPFVLAGAASFGAVGGLSSGRRLKIQHPADFASHVLSMSLIGSSVSMLMFWRFSEDPLIGYFCIGFSGINGILGMAPLEWLWKSVKNTFGEGKIVDFVADFFDRLRGSRGAK